MTSLRYRAMNTVRSAPSWSSRTLAATCASRTASSSARRAVTDLKVEPELKVESDLTVGVGVTPRPYRTPLTAPVRRAVSFKRPPADGQPLDAVHESGAQQGRFCGRDDVGNLAMQFLVGEPDLATCEVGAEAEVGATPAVSELRVRAAGDRQVSADFRGAVIT